MKLYYEASRFLTDSKSGSLQNRVFGSYRDKKIQSDPKHVYALVLSTLKYKPFILEIIKKCKLLTIEKKAKLTEPMALLLVHDLLFSKGGRIHSKHHPLKDAIVRNKTRLHAELTKLKLKHGVRSLEDLIEDDETPVRWFRANRVKTTAAKVVEELSHLRQVFSIEDIEKGTIYHDEYVTDLFGIHPREDLVSTRLYKAGEVIIQDRASCFPAFILNPQPGKDLIIDSCAAPGNKTTHLAAILRNSPESVIAFEKNKERAKVLEKMCDKAGGLGCIRVQQGDFTATNPEEYPQVTGLLVDPSCSGSGIFGRAFEENDAQEYTEERLKKLASFQASIMKHAMKFPNARKIVYSTCSIHAQENEQVVVDLLLDKAVQKQGWRVCNRKDVIPSWPRRGLVEEFSAMENPEACAEGCIRTMPKVEGGIGFFAIWGLDGVLLEVGIDGGVDPGSSFWIAHELQHQSTGTDGCNWVGNALSFNIWGRTVTWLSNGKVVSNVGRRNNTQRSNKSSSSVRQNVSVKVWSHNNVKDFWLTEHSVLCVFSNNDHVDGSTDTFDTLDWSDVGVETKLFTQSHDRRRVALDFGGWRRDCTEKCAVARVLQNLDGFIWKSGTSLFEQFETGLEVGELEFQVQIRWKSFQHLFTSRNDLSSNSVSWN
ncbi:hypothetical protein OGAPHI_005862 [Ogataea philodendri]|uniref:SAM-dependent MTase RsmB/NOP-type domain-containing protein n=1 Tax=Ogataea philodendri TaxID=1378263 RepID=A0A9P8NZK8_9ASCO|nr:uncharacterized protein OGAPHI_005862 [Ogataea philodendri]KAH3662610.1 hypothetical protein OGAPHI_005862 [Ogataea philodendri]